jgi:cell division protein FtsB
MAKDNNMPTKTEMIQFLERVEQLTENDNVFKEKLGSLLRKISDKTATQNDSLLMQNTKKSESNPLSSSKITELEQRIQTMQQDNDNLSRQLAQFEHTNKKLEEENMGFWDLFKRKEQDVSHLQQQISGINQDNQKLKQNNEYLNNEIQHLNQKIGSFSWAKSIKTEFDFLKQVQSHAEISKILLPNGDDNVLQLIAIAAQWNNVLRVWDALATQIKNTQQAISVTEQQIIEHSLALFNLTLQSNQATLKNPEFGESYDYEIHQKILGSGGSIEQVLLAGLYNAAGENVRAAIVTTR